MYPQSPIEAQKVDKAARSPMKQRYKFPQDEECWPQDYTSLPQSTGKKIRKEPIHLSLKDKYYEPSSLTKTTKTNNLYNYQTPKKKNYAKNSKPLTPYHKQTMEDGGVTTEEFANRPKHLTRENKLNKSNNNEYEHPIHMHTNNRGTPKKQKRPLFGGKGKEKGNQSLLSEEPSLNTSAMEISMLQDVVVDVDDDDDDDDERDYMNHSINISSQAHLLDASQQFNTSAFNSSLFASHMNQSASSGSMNNRTSTPVVQRHHHHHQHQQDESLFTKPIKESSKPSRCPKPSTSLLSSSFSSSLSFSSSSSSSSSSMTTTNGTTPKKRMRMRMPSSNNVLHQAIHQAMNKDIPETTSQSIPHLNQNHATSLIDAEKMMAPTNSLSATLATSDMKSLANDIMKTSYELPVEAWRQKVNHHAPWLTSSSSSSSSSLPY